MTDSHQENESAFCQPTTNQADKEMDEHAEWKTPRGDNQPSVCSKGGAGNAGEKLCAPLISLAALIPYHFTVQPRLCQHPVGTDYQSRSASSQLDSAFLQKKKKSASSLPTNTLKRRSLFVPPSPRQNCLERFNHVARDDSKYTLGYV